MKKTTALKQRIDELNEFIDYLEKVPDIREDWRLSHSLLEVLFIVFCSQINGFESFTEYEIYGKSKLTFLRRFLPYKNGCPSRVTFHRVLATLDPKTLEELLTSWTRIVINQEEPDVIAIDGKTHCGARGMDEKIHLVGAFATTKGIMIGQEKVADKSNEIMAIPLLLDKLYVENQIITIDAMGCQKAIARKIIEKKAHYILALKENHKTFHAEVALYFNDTENKVSTSETLEKARGRVETRRCSVTSDIDWFCEKGLWKNLTTIVKLESICHKKGKETTEIRYFITDLPPNADVILTCIRAHWGIENNLHWVLDVIFREDNRLLWNDNVLQNEAIIRRCALNVIRSYKIRYSNITAIKTIRKLLIGDDDEMEKILREF